ncbi:hypothetical protein [Afipia sp. P52-10]|uniref:hypothetical protein n=1 Tax=Afipia sp. P52-10 TaxID=1429916 RepID=UPI0004B757AE|nr:hypothetical protein [Afipia sp. P52-10]
MQPTDQFAQISSKASIRERSSLAGIAAASAAKQSAFGFMDYFAAKRDRRALLRLPGMPDALCLPATGATHMRCIITATAVELTV